MIDLRQLWFACAVILGSFAPNLAAADETQDCIRNLSNFHRQDSFWASLSAARVRKSFDQRDYALNAVDLFLGTLDCSDDILDHDTPVQVNCTELSHDRIGICLVRTHLGYFLVHETLTDTVTVQWNRWD